MRASLWFDWKPSAQESLATDTGYSVNTHELLVSLHLRANQAIKELRGEPDVIRELPSIHSQMQYVGLGKLRNQQCIPLP